MEPGAGEVGGATDAGGSTTDAAGRSGTTQPRRSLVGRLGTAVAERTVEVAVRLSGSDSPLAPAAAAAAARPAATRETVRKMLEREDVRRLARDEGLREAVYRGDVDAISRHAGVLRLLEDREVRRSLESLRLVENGGASSRALARELAGKVAPLGRSLDELRDDPEFRAAMERSRLVDRLRDRDLSGLAGDPDVVWMLERVREVMARRR